MADDVIDFSDLGGRREGANPKRRGLAATSMDEDDNNDDEVMRLAARLAPAFEEAHDLFQVPTEFQNTTKNPGGEGEDAENADDFYGMAEDDDLKREISDLVHSESLLRQELEHATFFSSLFGAGGGGGGLDDSFGGQDVGGGFDEGGDNRPDLVDEPEPDMDVGPSSEADIEQDDFDVPESRLNLAPADDEVVGSPYKQPSNIDAAPTTPNPKSKQSIDQYATPTSPKKTPGSVTSASGQKNNTPFSSPSSEAAVKEPLLVMGKTPVPYELSDHKESLEIAVQNGWYLADMNRFALPKSLRPSASQLPTYSDFCISCPENRLKTWYIGFTETSDEEKQSLPSLLPVRTSIIAIRPDVLVGAVMDALTSVATNLGDTQPGKVADHTILRRQGGHLRLVVSAKTTGSSETQFLVDSQLCTQKSQRCERVLVVRIFHYGSPTGGSNQTSPLANNRTNQFSHRSEDDDTPNACKHLQEACALVQRLEIEANNASSARRPIRFRSAQCQSLTDRDQMVEAFSNHLRRTYKACPSVTEQKLTLPALNSRDWELLKTSWAWSDAMWEELESRSLTYSSLATTRFGAFPCLPTLDVHYCSQMRRYSRESMIAQLLNYATQLEEYARDAEYACANVIALLKNSYAQYGVDPPPLPSPIPLTSYPLDYATPQAICPPWGLKVMEALNEVQVWVDEGRNTTTTPMEEFSHPSSPPSDTEQFLFGSPKSQSSMVQSTQLATRSVAAVLQAFQQQDDEEKNARLARKNSQVMDRLAFMKKHQIVSVQLLDTCTADIAQNAAADLARRTKIREVPLLKWNVMALNSTGTCIITANHLIFVTQNIPLLGRMGGEKVTKFNFKKDIDSFEIQENASGILGALSIAIQIVDMEGKCMFSFRPSTGGARFKKFLDIVLSIASESKSVLSS